MYRRVLVLENYTPISMPSLASSILLYLKGHPIPAPDMHSVCLPHIWYKSRLYDDGILEGELEFITYDSRAKLRFVAARGGQQIWRRCARIQIYQGNSNHCT